MGTDNQFHLKYNAGDIIKKFEDIKVVIRIVNRRTDNTMAKKKKDQRTNNELQNTTQKTKIEQH
jgi:hypothetical protein